jgi:glycosyltransferase involved in cell wall biosynthesis
VLLAQDVEKLAGAPCEFVPSVRQLPLPISNLNAPDLTPGGLHFLFIGRYEPNKGPDILVDAMRLFLNRGGNAHLHMFGDGSLRPQLLDRIRGFENNIHLRGYADPNTVTSYMKASDWLIIPSRIESIPLIFVDALQMRLPVIAADVGDLGMLVRRFGVGRVVPASNPEALATMMQAVQSQPREEFTHVWAAPLEVFNLRASVHRVEEAMLGMVASAL